MMVVKQQLLHAMSRLYEVFAKRGTYIGVTTMTLWPLAAMATGNDPMTSPRPPALLQGATSAAQNTMSSAVAHSMVGS